MTSAERAICINFATNKRTLPLFNSNGALPTRVRDRCALFHPAVTCIGAHLRTQICWRKRAREAMLWLGLRCFILALFFGMPKPSGQTDAVLGAIVCVGRWKRPSRAALDGMISNASTECGVKNVFCHSRN